MNDLAKKKAERPSLDVWIRAVASQIRRACRGKYYGSITLEITNGWPTRIKIDRSVKDPRTVALDDEEPVG